MKKKNIDQMFLRGPPYIGYAYMRKVGFKKRAHIIYIKYRISWKVKMCNSFLKNYTKVQIMLRNKGPIKFYFLILI